MNYKKTEDNASLEQKRKQQMKSSGGVVDQQSKIQKYEEDIQNNLATIRQLKISPTSNGLSSDRRNPTVETKTQQGFINQAQSGVNSSKQGKELQAELQQQQSMQSASQQKKASFANQVQEQYSKIKNPILTEIMSDENETKSFLAMFFMILAFWVEQVVFKEYVEFYEYIMISVFLFFTLGQYYILYQQQYRYLHLIQMVNSLMVIFIIGMWVYNSQQLRKSSIDDYADRLILQTVTQQNTTNNGGSTSSPTAYKYYMTEQQNVIKNNMFLLFLQSESKFFFQGAILLRLQECLNKHLIPKYRLTISIVSVLVMLIIFYKQQYSVYDSLEYDVGIKCLFLIIILAFYEQVQMKNLCSYLISFQALKKYFTLSLCTRSCHGLSNNIQIEVNPENLSSCKVIQGNQQLSELLLSDSLRFFREFELDPQSISNYNKVDQVEEGEERAISQDGDMNNFDFGASTEKLKTKNISTFRQKVRQQSKYSTVSKQFIDRKIMKCSSSSFNRKRNSKQSNQTIVSLKRFSHTEKIDGKEGEVTHTQGLIHTHQGINKTENNIQTFRNHNNNILSVDFGTKQTQLPNTINSNLLGNNQIEKDLNQTNGLNSMSKAQKTSIKSEDNPTNSNQQNDLIIEKPNQSFDKKEHQDNQSIKTNEQSKIFRPPASSLGYRYHTLEDIIKDPVLRSVQISGKFKKNENSKVQYLSITLLKYFNIFQKETIIASITDITSIQEINNLQREVQFKESMFANVTHDLRTPLYAIKYSIDKLKEIFHIHQCNTLLEQREQIQQNIKDLQDNEVNDLHEQINISVANTHLMEAIIQDIIDNNRNRMGKLETDVRQFNLMEMLQEMKKLMEIILWEKRKNIKIRFDICKQIKQNSLIYSDSQRLKQVLMNLISNSIKFTKKGGILIKVSKVFLKSCKNVDQYLNLPFKNTLRSKVSELVDQNDFSGNFGNTSLAEKTRVQNENQQYLLQQENIFQYGLIQFQIIDSGIGMNSKILKNLFTPYNTHNNDNMNRHGIGLGLTICKTIVEKLGPFQLKVASKEQRGSKFTFYIYHELQQSMIPSKLEQINPDQKKQNDISQNNMAANISRNHNNNNHPEEDFHFASPRSFINLIPHTSEQNLKSEPYLDQEFKDKPPKSSTPPPLSKRKELDYGKQNQINHSVQAESDRQSSSNQQEVKKKVSLPYQRGITNGSIFQFYSQNNQLNNERINVEKSDRDSRRENEQMDERIEDQKRNNNGMTLGINLANPNESEILLTKSPKFVSFNNYSSLNYQSMNQHNNPHANSDSTIQIKETETFNKSNTLQKFSFGMNSTVIKKNPQQSLQETTSKNITVNGSADYHERELFDGIEKFKKRETEWQVQLVSSRQDQQNVSQQQINQHKLTRDTTDFLVMPSMLTQNASSGMNSTIASLVIGQKTANEKKENETQNPQPLSNTPIVQVTPDFTASRQRIHSNPLNHKNVHNVLFDQSNLQQIIQPHFQNFFDDNLQQKSMQPLNSPQVRVTHSGIKKRLQDPKNKSYDHLKGLKNEIMEQNYFLSKAQLFKNQESVEYMYGNESSIQLNPYSQAALPFPSCVIATQSKVTNIKSQSKLQKNQSYTQLDPYIDDQYLEEDQQFNTSILLSLEDNQEHINIEESNANHLIKNNNFQVMVSKKQVSPLESNANLIQKSVRESQLCSVDKKGLYISKIDRYNHVTNHKMTESVQLNYIKKIKFGIANDSDDNQEKQFLNILICDDSIFNIKILQKMLLNCKKYKMQIDTCLSGEEAIEKFLKKNKANSSDPYNYIFLDWNMPIMDGYETSSKIKFYVKDESFLDCPIIICTAYEDTTEINKCLRNGTDGILTKPISQEQINELLQDFQQSKENYKRISNN